MQPFDTGRNFVGTPYCRLSCARKQCSSVKLSIHGTGLGLAAAFDYPRRFVEREPVLSLTL